MPSRTAGRKRAATVIRSIGFALALVLGVVGVWLIVTSGNSTQRVEIGVLTGLWALLLGAISGRRTVVVSEPANVHAAQPVSPLAGSDLTVPALTGLDRAEAAAVRRTFAAELHAMLRRELANAVDSAISREVGELRDEVAELRSELLERVSGQLRLQRIETTTLIGSDLDAMRAEVRGMHDACAPPGLAAEIDVDHGAGNGDVTSVPQPVERQPVVQLPLESPVPEPPSVHLAPAGFAADPFAALPKLTPFTAFPLEPIETPQTDGRGGFGQPPVPEPARPARHARAADATSVRPAGRRRRADDPEGQELLARLLARERGGR